MDIFLIIPPDVNKERREHGIFCERIQFSVPSGADPRFLSVSSRTPSLALSSDADSSSRTPVGSRLAQANQSQILINLYEVRCFLAVY